MRLSQVLGIMRWTLFPGIRQHRSWRHSDAPSKAFSRVLTEIGIKGDKLSFRSLRKTFCIRIKSFAPQDAEHRERLVGLERLVFFPGVKPTSATDSEICCRSAPRCHIYASNFSTMLTNISIDDIPMSD